MPDDGFDEKANTECRGRPPEQAELTIEALTAGGAGVARPAGRVWFVPGGLPGDRVRAAAVRMHPRFVEARLVGLVRESPDRRSPACPFQPTCGGCPWMPLAEVAQRRFKQQRVDDALSRIGGVSPSVTEPIRFGALPLAYRNRIELTLGRDAAGRPLVGLHAGSRSAALVDVDRCLLQPDAANSVLTSVREFLLAPRRLWSRSTAPRFRIAIRSGEGGEVLVALWEEARAFPEAAALAEWLTRRHPELCGVVRVRTHGRRRGGARVTALYGRTWVAQQVGATRFRVPAASFTQVNADWTERLPDLVRECAGDVAGADVVDLYGGIGVHGIALAGAGARNVTICEADARAVRCGVDAVRRAGLQGVRFVVSDVRAFLGQAWPAELQRVVVANPPRAGLESGVARRIAARACERVVIVSCDPATLARDVRVFIEHGFRLLRVIPVDLFPQTPHVETVAVLARGGGPS